MSATRARAEKFCPASALPVVTQGGTSEAPPITLLTTRCQKDQLTWVSQREEFSMNEPELILADNPDSEARQLIDDKLGAYNAEQAGYWDPRPLAVLVRDPVSHLLFIDLVFLPE